MIIVTAQDLSQFLNYITFYAQSLMRDKDTIQDIILGFEDLLSLVDDRRKVSDDDAFRILGFDNQARGLSSLIASYFRRSTKIEFLNLILDIIKIYNKYDDFLSSGGSRILSEVTNLLNKESVIRDMPEPLQEIVFKEEIPEEEVTIESGLSPEKRSSWYVTSGEKFSTTTSFYGPFSTNLSAIVFSILIHRPGFAEEGSVLTGDKVLAILRMADKRIVDLDSAKDIHGAAVVNEVLPGRIKSASLEYTRGEYELELSTSGDIFDSFLEFMKESANFPQDATVSFQEVVSWINSDAPLTFPNFYFEKTGNYNVSHDAPQEFDEIDPAIPETSEIKKELSTAPTEPEKVVELPPSDSSSPSSETTQSLRLPIFSPLNPEVLSDASILEYFQEIRQRIISFDGKPQDMMNVNYAAYFVQIQNLLKEISDKDFETKNTLKEFREKHRLEISADINYEWEFRQKFSILNKILQDTKLFESLTSVVGKIVLRKIFSDLNPNSEINKIFSNVIRVTSRNIVSEEASDLDSAKSEVMAASQEEILRVVDFGLKKIINSFVNSPGLEPWMTSEILYRLINDIGIGAIARGKAKEYFSNKEKIISSQRFYTVQCGVCSQQTQIPEQYKDFMENFSEEVKQYSFFRVDGSLITEFDLIGGETPKKYDLSSEMRSLIERYINNTRGSSISRSLKDLIGRQFTWEEVNLMISNPQDIGPDPGIRIQQNIFGLMIRNDILKNYFDAVPSGGRGIFPGRSLCAGSLMGLKEDIKASETSKKFLEQRQNYRCNAAVAANYSTSIDVPKYQSSAYISPNGNIATKSEVDSYFVPGFRFSRFEVKCPCHIGPESGLLDLAIAKKSYKNIFEGIAIPNIPENIANDISSKFEFDPSLIYHAPTTPDGELAKDLSSAGYVVCAKKVSLSMFDRDPSSKNYIRNVLSKSLSGGGPRELMSLVNALINHGVEMNDLKPHVESVVSAGTATKFAKKKILKDLFNSVKISLAQSSLETQESAIKDVGLVCEHGHKFTVGQSWEFARTHAAIRPYGRVSERALITRPVSLKDIISLAKASPADSMKMMLTLPSQEDIGFGVFESGLDEEELKKLGFKQPSDASSKDELLSLIRQKKIYFKSDDRKIYKLAKSSQKGALTESPWTPNSINRITQTSVDMNLFAGGMQGLTRTSEDGKEYEADLGDPQSLSRYYGSDSDSEDRSRRKYGRSTDLATYDMEMAKILLPEINIDTLKAFNKNPGTSATQSETKFLESAKMFIEKFIVALKFSRVWGTMAADYNLDFLRRPSSFPVADAKIKEDIEEILKELLSAIGKRESEYNSIINSFFTSYDVLGLISRSVTQDKFLSLAGIIPYYAGFKPPNVINKNENQIKELVTKSLAFAVKENLPQILRIENPDTNTSNLIADASGRLASYLLMPYQKNYKGLFENAIVDYSGRALVFSFSINVIDRIKSFYSKFFFNQQSPLYIGSYGSKTKAMSIIEEELLKNVVVNDISIPNILMMNESDFSNKISELKSELEEMYSGESLQDLVKGYISSKNIPVANPDEDEELDQFYIQYAIVTSKLSKSFDLAQNTIEIVFSDLAGKPMGDISIKKSAKILDVVIEPLMQERDPENFEQNKDRILKSRERYGELSSTFSDGIFATNAVTYARINLTSENESLDPVVSCADFFATIELDKKYLVNVDSAAKFSPRLSILKKISVNKKSYKEKGKEMYLCLVPFETDFIGSDLLKEKVDIINFLGPEIIKLDSTQGREFASRYLSGLSGVDYSRLVIFDSKCAKSLSPTKLQDRVLDFATKRVNFEVMLSKINNKLIKSSNFWPPQKNLLFDNPALYSESNLGESEGEYKNLVEEINSGYNKLAYSLSHSDFITSLENFNTSKTTLSPDVHSSHGVVIPLRGSEDDKRAARISTQSFHADESLRSPKDLVSISDLGIYIGLESGKKLDISWAFKSLDPQIIDENKRLRHKLVQSGVVQKMDYISKKMNLIYGWLSSSGKYIFKEISNQKYTAGVDLSSFDRFLDTFFSSLSPFVKISANYEKGTSYASLDISGIDFSIISETSKDKKEEFIKNLSELVDYYNASQTLNSIYLNLRPTITTADTTNIKTNTNGRSIAIKLLDPYSLWSIVSNPAMSTRFGGPIKPEDVDDYKSFIIETFGLEDIVSGIVNATGIDASKFRESDLFDLAGFYNRRLKEDIPKERESLEKFAQLFKLDVGEFGAKTYINGFPISKYTGFSKTMEQIISNVKTSNFILDSSSYIEHPYKLSSSLSDLSEEKINEIRDRIRSSIYQDKPLVNEITEKSLEELKDKINDPNYDQMLKGLIISKIERLISEKISEQSEIKEIRAKNKRLQSGEDAPTLEDLDSLARSFGTQRKNSPFSWSDYRALTMEINSNLRKIVSSLYNPQTKTAGKLISWRKIAQSVTDEESTMIRSLYHKWWEQYLNIMAKMAS